MLQLDFHVPPVKACLTATTSNVSSIASFLRFQNLDPKCWFASFSLISVIEMSVPTYNAIDASRGTTVSMLSFLAPNRRGRTRGMPHGYVQLEADDGRKSLQQQWLDQTTGELTLDR